MHYNKSNLKIVFLSGSWRITQISKRIEVYLKFPDSIYREKH